MKTIFRAGLAGVLVSLAMVGNAFAHAMLVGSAPQAGSAVTAPSEVTLRFSAPIEANFSQIELKDSGGKKQAASAAVDPADHKILKAKLAAPLAAGAYTLFWRIVATDSHVMKGSYKFTVKQ